jgi:hypothetical protein
LNEDKWFNQNFLRQFDLVVINVLYASIGGVEHQVDYLDFLNEAGVRKVIIFGGLYTFSAQLTDLIHNHGFDQRKIQEFAIDTTFGDTLIASATKRYGYFYVSKKDEFCFSGSCSFWLADGTPMTWDRHHLSLEYASSMLDLVGRRLDKYLMSGVRSNK